MKILTFCLKGLYTVLFGLPVIIATELFAILPMLAIGVLLSIGILLINNIGTILDFTEISNPFRHITIPLERGRSVAVKVYASIWHPQSSESAGTPKNPSWLYRIGFFLTGLVLFAGFWFAAWRCWTWLMSDNQADFSLRSAETNVPVVRLQSYDTNVPTVRLQSGHSPGEPVPSATESKPGPEALGKPPEEQTEKFPSPVEWTPPRLPQPEITPPGYSHPLPPNAPQPESGKPTAAEGNKSRYLQGSEPIPLTELTSRDVPFVNSLGMKFVPVPMTKVLFCIHEVRKADFMNFKRDSGQQFSPPIEGSLSLFEDNMPINWISKSDAEAFCEWLSDKEGRVYRLPMDHEWSCAVGLGELESQSESPQEKDGKIAIYPWGSEFPPPVNAGNYQLAGYEDGYDGIAPVMSYAPNQFGIYDLGGNVCEWCMDRYRTNGTGHVIRGGGWFNFGKDFCLSSQRVNPGQESDSGWGFRCVLDESRK